LPRSFDSVFYGAAGASGEDLPSDDQFNRVSFLSHFEGANNGVNNAFDDGSANNYTVTAAGDVTQGSFGPFAREAGYWGIDFLNNTGARNGLKLCEGYQTELVMTGTFTIEFWLYHRYVNGYQTFFGSGGGFSGWNSSTGHEITFFAGGNDAYCQFYGGSSHVSTLSITLNPGEWNHVALVNNGGNWTTYLNGVGNTTQTKGNVSAISSTGSWASYIGCGNGSGDNNPCKGIMSNVRFVKGTAVYTSNFTPSTAPLTAITNTSSLVAQNNRFVDNSSHANTVTPTGAIQITAFGPFLTDAVYNAAVNGASAYMDGSGDTLRATWTAADIINQNFTLEYWLYYTQTSGYGTVSIGANNNTAGYTSLTYLASDGQVFSDDGQNSGSGPDAGAGAISPNSWNHLALVRVSNDMFIYINGAKVATKAITASLFQGQSGEFGIGYIANPLEGYISDARVVTSAVYTGNTYTVPTAPLTAITNTKLLLNMADGQAIDSAAQTNMALYDGANISTTQKKFGNSSVYLDGDDLVRTAVNPSFAFGTGDFTIEGWVYLTAINQYDNIFDMRHSGSTTHIDVYFDGSPLRLRYYVNGGERFTSDTAVSLNTWTHLALVRSSGTTKLYQQGTSVGSYSDSTNLSSGQLHLGGRYSNQNFAEGYFDEVRVSNMARYTSNFTAPTAAFPDKGQDE